MKPLILKIIIVVLVVVGIIWGVVYYLTLPPIQGKEIATESNLKIETIEKDIQENIEGATDLKFCPSMYDDVLKRINLFFENEPSNKQTYTLQLQYAYTQKFVKQANYVFDKNKWHSSDITIIRKELGRCKKFSPDDAGLKSIDNVLKDYDKLINYNKEVKIACSQRPQCMLDSKWLYKNDDWDISKTNELLNSVPNITSKAKNAPIYQQTRTSEVERRLKKAHKQFIEDKMNCAEKEAKGYNYHSSRQNDLMHMSDELYKNFETYKEKWKETTSEWQKKVAAWEQYVMPQTSTTNNIY